jgi:hypothetical protein
VQDLYGSGGSISGGEWQVAKISALKNAAIQGWVVDVKVHYGKQVVRYGSTQPDKVNRAGQLVASFQVHRATSWRVLQWTRGS